MTIYPNRKKTGTRFRFFSCLRGKGDRHFWYKGDRHFSPPGDRHFWYKSACHLRRGPLYIQPLQGIHNILCRIHQRNFVDFRDSLDRIGIDKSGIVSGDVFYFPVKRG